MRASIFLFVIFLLQTPAFLYAQLDNTRFSKFSIEDGLNHSAITDLHQDKNGYIWIGTQGILYKYDGKSFLPFESIQDDSSTISHNYVYTIEEDKDGNLWIGTRGGGLNKYDLEERRFFRYMADPTSPQLLSTNAIRAILPDESGHLWIGGVDGILNQFDPQTGATIRHVLPSRKEGEVFTGDIFDIIQSSTNTDILWIASRKGLYKFDKRSNTATYVNGYSNGTGIDEAIAMYCLYEDRQGIIWIGSNKKGIQFFDSTTETFLKNHTLRNNQLALLKSTQILRILEDREGVYWLGTATGLIRLETTSEKIALFIQDKSNPNSLSHSLVTGLLQDTSGLLWIGTYVGLNTYNPLSDKIDFFGLEEGHTSSLRDSEVLALAEDHSRNVWIGTNAGGLNKLDIETGGRDILQ